MTQLSEGRGSAGSAQCQLLPRTRTASERALELRELGIFADWEIDGADIVSRRGVIRRLETWIRNDNRFNAINDQDPDRRHALAVNLLRTERREAAEVSKSGGGL